MISKNTTYSIIKFFGTTGLIVFLVHYIMYETLNKYLYAPEILYANLFIFIITVISVFAVAFITKKLHPGMTGFIFLGTSLAKMVLSVIYLLPILRGDFSYQISYVIQFFIIYFCYLFAEVLYLSRKFKNIK